MTADSKLLPLPLKQALDLHIPSGVRFYGHSNESMQDYARANVAHATAAKDAEIEALRADRDSFKQQAEHNLLLVERLAEALRFYADTNNWIGRFVTDPTTPAEEDGGDNAREALRDHSSVEST